MDSRIIVVTHKEYPMPENELYLPLFAGAAVSYHVPDGFVRDDEGDNISDRNRSYCELTGLYWAWKNLPEDVRNLGLCHYRRYFASPGHGRSRNKILNGSEADALMQNFDVILPRARRYYIESNYSQYAHAHHEEDLLAVREVIAERHPEYLEHYDRRMKMTSGHRFNMFLMKRELSDEYCEWLFDILFELERRLDTSGYSERDRRVFGFVSERLLDVWLDAGSCRCMDLPYIFEGRERLAVKAAKLVLRKLSRGRIG